MSDESSGGMPHDQNGGSVIDWRAALSKLTVATGAVGTKVAAATGAVRAVNRLVIGVTDIGIAWSESRAEEIRADSKAQSQMTRGLGVVAAKRAASNPQLVDRAVERWTRNLIKTQENREAIALRAIDILKDSPLPQDVDHGPSDDFMNVFEEIAEKASSESLRDLLARTLAGEIRKPGMFSLRTLHFISTVDQPLAIAIQKARPWVIGAIIPMVTPIITGPRWEVMFALQEAGLYEANLEHRAALGGDGHYVLTFSGANVGLLLSGLPNADFRLSVAGLTSVGKQVMELLPATSDVESYKLLAQGILDDACAPLDNWKSILPGRDIKPVKRVAVVKLPASGSGKIGVGDEIWAVGPSVGADPTKNLNPALAPNVLSP